MTAPQRRDRTARRRGRFALVFALLAATSSTASADPPAPQPPPLVARKNAQADRDAARTLAEQGFDQLQKRRFDNAIALFQKAEERFHAPTHLLYIAQAHEGRGRLVEAVEVYRRIAAETLARDAPQPFRDAQAEAVRAIDPLVKRTPKLRVDVTGEGAPEAVLTIGDRPGKPGVSDFYNPGTYDVTATAAGFTSVTRAVLLSENGGEITVRIDMPRPWSIAWPATALGLGVASAGAAITTGLLAHDWSLQAAEACEDLIVCPEEQSRKQADAHALRDVSIATTIAGGVLLAGGVTLLLLRPTSKATVTPASAEAASTRLSPTVALRAGPSFIGLRGTF